MTKIDRVKFGQINNVVKFKDETVHLLRLLDQIEKRSFGALTFGELSRLFQQRDEVRRCISDRIPGVSDEQEDPSACRT